MKNFSKIFAVILLLAFPAQAYAAIGSAGPSAAMGDTVGTLGVLNAANTTATIAVNGQNGAGMLLASGTLVGTIVPEVGYTDGSGNTTWVTSLFYDPATGTTATAILFASANPVTVRTIMIPGGVSNARVRVSAFTSGTANATLRATRSQLPDVALAIPGSDPGVAAPAKSTVSVQNPSLDPCQVYTHNYTPINITTATTTRVVDGTISGLKTFVCYLNVLTNDVNNVGVVHGSGATCGTSTLGVFGGPTSASYQLTAVRMQLIFGTGANAVGATTVNGNSICLITSASQVLSGVLVWVSGP